MEQWIVWKLNTTLIFERFTKQNILTRSSAPNKRCCFCCCFDLNVLYISYYRSFFSFWFMYNLDYFSRNFRVNCRMGIRQTQIVFLNYSFFIYDSQYSQLKLFDVISFFSQQIFLEQIRASFFNLVWKINIIKLLFYFSPFDM